ncbi:MAG: cytochrome c [Pyrinomonadaceae bacterium]
MARDMERNSKMKNILKIITAALFSAAALFFVVGGVSASKSAIASAESSEQASAKRLYLQHCSSCHGANGRAQTVKGRRLEAADLTSAFVKELSRDKVVRAISNGRPQMPAFRKKLTAKQIAMIANYVRGM